METGSLILLGLLGAAAILGGVGYRAYQSARRSALGAMLALGKIKEELSETPKSLNAMTEIYLPAILKDFPGFNLYEFIPRAEQMLKSALEAIDKGDISLLRHASESLKAQVKAEIEEGGKQYKNVKIHRTAIANYVKRGGNCVIVLQTSLEYNDGIDKQQSRYNVDLVYVQDVEKLSAGEMDKALGLRCPSCGAPVKGLGRAVCEYCGSGIEPINIYAWRLNRFQRL